jgi:hypothetical protein
MKPAPFADHRPLTLSTQGRNGRFLQCAGRGYHNIVRAIMKAAAPMSATG